jgi:hypothetical protein
MVNLNVLLLLSLLILGSYCGYKVPSDEPLLLKYLSGFSYMSLRVKPFDDLISDFEANYEILEDVCTCEGCLEGSSFRILSHKDEFKKFLNDTYYAKKNNTFNTVRYFTEKSINHSFEWFCSQRYSNNSLSFYCIQIQIKAKLYQKYKEKGVKRELEYYEKEIVQSAVKAQSLAYFLHAFNLEYDRLILKLSTNDTDISDDQKAIDNQKIDFSLNLRRIISTEIREKPHNYDSLMKDIKSVSDIKMDSFLNHEFVEYSFKNNLPSEVINDLYSVSVLSDKFAKKDIKYYYAKESGKVNDLIGYAVKKGDKIFFSYIRSETTCVIPVRKKKVEREECHTSFLVIKKCHTVIDLVDDPYTIEEINKIKQALLAINMEKIQKKIDLMDESQTLLGNNAIINSPYRIYSAKITDNAQISIYETSTGKQKSKIGNYFNDAFKPYNLQINNKGNIYIINKNNLKVWSAKITKKGKAPYTIELTDEGNFYLKDAENNILFER